MQIKNTLDLRTEIYRLELRSKQQKELLLDQLHDTYESLKPRNILHNAVTNITRSPNLTDKVLKTAGSLVGTLATALLPKKLLFGLSVSLISKIGGMVFAAGIKRDGGNYAHQVNSGSPGLIKRLTNKFIR